MVACQGWIMVFFGIVMILFGIGGTMWYRELSETECDSSGVRGYILALFICCYVIGVVTIVMSRFRPNYRAYDLPEESPRV